MIRDWLGFDCSIKLIYRATKNGFAGPKFHFICDNKGPSLTVLKSQNGFIFGGYTSVKQYNPPNINPHFERDPEAFLFQLHPHKTKHERLPGKEKCVARGKQRICVFGRTLLDEENSDLEVIDECNTHNHSWANLGHCFALPASMTHGSEDARCYLAGTPTFKVTEFEVFQIKKIKK